MDLIAGALVGGKYELQRALASGGMGSLWVARHTELCTEVAIKFISEAYAGSSLLRSRFVREARAAAHIVSNHVVRVHDYGVEDDSPYLVMELLKGEDLGVRLKREGRLPIDVVAGLFVQIARGLRRAHKAGFVHRDLKPSNIFLARSGDGDDEEESVKLLDFGVAKETDVARGGPTDEPDERTKTGEIMGSPHYMSPEQIRESKDIDARSDLWSLAVILFRALTGNLPFEGEAAGPIMSKILTDPIPVPSQIVPSLPRAVDDFFWKAFQRDPERRFQSACEMALAFSDAAGVRSAKLSFTRPGASMPLRRWLDVPLSGCPTPSSTLPAPGVAPVDGTLRCAEGSPLLKERGAPPAAGEHVTVVDGADHDDEPSCASGTLSASSIAVIGGARVRRPLLGWTLGAAGAAGVLVGWILIGFLANPKGIAPNPPQRPAVVAAVAPLSPAFSVPAPSDPSAIDPSERPRESRASPPPRGGASTPGSSAPASPRPSPSAGRAPSSRPRAAPTSPVLAGRGAPAPKSVASAPPGFTRKSPRLGF